MVFGNLVDCLLLTPDEFQNRYIIIPEDAPRRPTSAQLNAKNPSADSIRAIEWWAGFEKHLHGIKDATGKRPEVITQAMYDEARYIVEKVLAYQPAAELLQRINSTQQYMRWVDNETKLPVKAFLDGDGDDLILEVKTAASADPEEFAKQAFNLDYHLQCGTYLHGARHRGQFNKQFAYLVIEKDPPYGICVMMADSDYRELGIEQYAELMQDFRYCYDNNLWHEGYEFKRPFGYSHLDLPGYAKSMLKKHQ
jgi:exodeoxyribonuclease VIII